MSELASSCIRPMGGQRGAAETKGFFPCSSTILRPGILQKTLKPGGNGYGPISGRLPVCERRARFEEWKIIAN